MERTTAEAKVCCDRGVKLQQRFGVHRNSRTDDFPRHAAVMNIGRGECRQVTFYNSSTIGSPSVKIGMGRPVLSK